MKYAHFGTTMLSITWGLCEALLIVVFVDCYKTSEPEKQQR